MKQHEIIQAEITSEIPGLFTLIIHVSDALVTSSTFTQ